MKFRYRISAVSLFESLWLKLYNNTGHKYLIYFDSVLSAYDWFFLHYNKGKLTVLICFSNVEILKNNMGNFLEEQKEWFHQDMQEMESRYQGQQSKSILGNCIRILET